MKLSANSFDHVSVLTLSGEFTADDVEQFERVANERQSAGSRHLVLDCQHMEFIDSAALESVLHVQEALGAGGGQLRLVQPDDVVSTILRLTRLDLALESHPTLEAAVRSLR